MDASRFDTLARTLSVPDSRRRVLGLLAAVPLIGGLLGIADADDAAAKERRRRRKQRHKRRKDKNQHQRTGKQAKTCQPASHNQVCTGKCGKVKSRQTCGKTVDCGTCDCSPACEECFTCQGAPGACVPRQAGTPCGEAATCRDGVLQPQGSCDGNGVCSAADPVSCAPYTRCADNACASSCTTDDDCAAGSFCESGTCVGDGDNGVACTHAGQCASGHCVEQVCCDTACVGECVACNLPGSPGACAPRESGTPCGEAASCEAGTRYPQSRCDGAGACAAAEPVSCAPYTRCDENACATSCTGDGGCSDGYFCDTDKQQCVPERTNGDRCETGNQCTSGHCVNDVCCVAASCGTCQVCDLSGNGTCTTAPNGTGCGGENVCCGGTCQECCDSEQCADDHLACIGGVCKACTSDAHCGSNALCIAGACHACDVHCASGSAETCGESLKQALRGSKATLYVCPGTYQGGFSITRNVTIIGAGEGEAPAANTLLDGGGTQRVMNIRDANVTLKRVRVTHGDGSEGGAGTDGGGGIKHWGGALTMEHATVAHNTGRAAGGIMINATLTMTNCTVRDNTAPADNGSASGGGLTVLSGATLTDCLVADNTCDGEGGGFHLGTNASLVLEGETKVQGNTAQWGGGIYSTVPSNHSVTIGENCRITRNTAQNGRGGGIYRATTGPVILQGPAGTSPIVTDNCHENCAGDAVDKCAASPVFCPV